MTKEQLTEQLIAENGRVLIKIEYSANAALSNDTFYTVYDFMKITQEEEAKKSAIYKELSPDELGPTAEYVKFRVIIPHYYDNIEGLYANETEEIIIGKEMGDAVKQLGFLDNRKAALLNVEMGSLFDPKYKFVSDKLVYQLNHIDQELTYHNTVESLEKHSNMYVALRERHQMELDDFPWFAAFDEEQFNEGMEKLGLSPDDRSLVMAVPPGIIIKQSDNQAYFDMQHRWTSEHISEIMKDDTGLGYIYDMFSYELKNHEYGYTGSVEDTLLSLNITPSLIEYSDTLKKGFELAKLTSFLYDDGTSKINNMLENGKTVDICEIGNRKYVLSASPEYYRSDFKYVVRGSTFSLNNLEGQSRYCRNIDEVRKYVIGEVHRTDIENYVLTGKNRYTSTGASGNKLSSGAEI